MPTRHAPSHSHRPSFLRRLASDRSGNILAISAAAVLPMIGVVGGAIDISRMYLVKSRVQAACDAAVLAGRKAMTNNTYDTASRNRANAMFNFNFQDADYGTTATSFTSSANAQGKLTGNVSTTIPMTLMQLFGFNSRTLNVICSADIQVPNIDVVFVLDVTGSMNDKVGGARKIDSLKLAAKDFESTMRAALVGNERSQVRYGFVPYSQGVNVSELFRANPNQDPVEDRGELPLTHIADTMVTESRVANFKTPVEDMVRDTSQAAVSFNQTFNFDDDKTYEPGESVTKPGSLISNQDCDFYGQNLGFNIGSINQNVFLKPATRYTNQGEGERTAYRAQGSSTWVKDEPTNVNSYIQATFARVSSTWNDDSGADTKKFRTCTRRVTHERFVKRTRYKFTNWTYRPVTYDISAFKKGEDLSFVSAISDNYLLDQETTINPQDLRNLPNQAGLTSTSIRWNGCVEERDTVARATFTPIPAAAFDLNYLDGGTTPATRWRTMLDGLSYYRTTLAPETTTERRDTMRTIYANAEPNPLIVCPPTSARNLRVMSTKAFGDYIDTLTPQGNTYHDLGMVWALRMISPQGMFGTRNLTGSNGGQISRHIIFLTDGELRTDPLYYTSHGVEALSRRVSNNLNINQLSTYHANRFQALCDSQRGLVSIWVIGFGTSITGNLTDCADPGRAYEAKDQAQLQEAFRNIAKEVADLRLVE